MHRSPVLLATAVVNVLSRDGEAIPLRALLDQGSEVSFISEAAAQSLKLSRRSAAIPIIGIGAQRNNVSNGLVTLNITSRINAEISLKIDALVLPKLTTYLPPAQINYYQWSHLNGLQLADPHFSTPGKIDLIFGGSVYSQILEDGLCRGTSEAPIAQKTSLGWVLSGPLAINDPSDSISVQHSVTGLQCSIDNELLDSLQRFWSQEEFVSQPYAPLSPEETQCENHFQTTHSRDLQGRFVVRLPLKRSVIDFGDSRTVALQSLKRLENRFLSNSVLKSAYSDFLKEYRDLDHLRPVGPSSQSQRQFFLPHHGVIRETSSTTKRGI